MKLEENNGYFISYYMIHKLCLKGAELPVFALINKYSDMSQEFYWSQSQVAYATGLTVRSIQIAINKLCEKKYIIKRTERKENGTLKCYYHTNYYIINEILDHDKDIAKNFRSGSEKNSLGSEKNSHKNINKNINNIITNNSYIEPLQNYILQVFSNTVRELYFPNSSITINENTITLTIPEKVYKIWFIDCETKYIELLERQVKFWNTQKHTSYDFEIIKKVG